MSARKESKPKTNPVKTRSFPKKRRSRRKSDTTTTTRKSNLDDPPKEGEPVVPEENWSLSRFDVPSAEGKTRFHDFDLPLPLFNAIFDLGFRYCTPIQAEILPSTLAGKDASGRAQTGTGKTAAFLITVIDRLLKNPASAQRKPGVPRVLVLAPTRELVLQIADEARQLGKYCHLNIMAVFGGMDYEKQKRQLNTRPADIVVATPGRLLDYLRRRDIFLKQVEVLIIDEADRMLDMGFIPDIRKIVFASPQKDKRQTLLFSATLTGEILRLASRWTRDPVFIEIEPEQVAVETVDQIVYIVTAKEKFTLLLNIIEQQHLDRVLVFCNRRDEVSGLAMRLARYGINCAELSGDIPQKKRIRRLEDFKNGKIRVLVATDVAGRGIHVEGMGHVINFTLPNDPENYVHRIGRTGRAGAVGISISFADEDDAFQIPAIEEFTGRSLPCIEPDENWLSLSDELIERKKNIARRKGKASGGVRPRTKRTRRSRRRKPRPSSSR